MADGGLHDLATEGYVYAFPLVFDVEQVLRYATTGVGSLVANEIDRYSIGDRTPGLVTDADGGVIITMSHARPADAANWLPAPAGEFRPLLRMYAPGPSVLDGTYRLPPVVRVP